jgi:hypothetical protein
MYEIVIYGRPLYTGSGASIRKTKVGSVIPEKVVGADKNESGTIEVRAGHWRGTACSTLLNPEHVPQSSTVSCRQTSHTRSRRCKLVGFLSEARLFGLCFPFLTSFILFSDQVHFWGNSALSKYSELDHLVHCHVDSRLLSINYSSLCSVLPTIDRCRVRSTHSFWDPRNQSILLVTICLRGSLEPDWGCVGVGAGWGHVDGLDCT